MHVGFAGYFSKKVYEDQALSSQLASLFLDDRWPWPLTSVIFGQRAGFSKRGRRQKLSGKEAKTKLISGMRDPEGRDASLDHRASAEENHARLNIETGQLLVNRRAANPTKITGQVKGIDLPKEANLLSWVELMHQIMSCLDIANGVLTVWPTEYMVDADTIFVNIMLDTPKSVHNLGVQSQYQIQNSHVKYWRPELGDKYIRHPRWGNYLRRAHLELVGGLSRIRDIVPLAKVLELGGQGDLVYLQCTEHPAGALTQEGEQVRQALEVLLAPIVAPPPP